MADLGDLRAAQTRSREAEQMIDEATFAYLKKRCPFVALEMERQGFQDAGQLRSPAERR